MGRKKLEIKRIEGNSARMVCFSKRRNGLIKKVKELSILCDVDVAAVIFSNRGKLFQYCSTNSIEQVLQQYRDRVETEQGASTGACEAKDKSSEHSGFLTSDELLETVERELEEPRVDDLSVTDLILLEKQLEDALMQTRSTKTQVMLDTLSRLHEEENMLAEEKKSLKEIAGSSKQARKKNRTVDLNIVADGETTE